MFKNCNNNIPFNISSSCREETFSVITRNSIHLQKNKIFIHHALLPDLKNYFNQTLINSTGRIAGRSKISKYIISHSAIQSFLLSNKN